MQFHEFRINKVSVILCYFMTFYWKNCMPISYLNLIFNLYDFMPRGNPVIYDERYKFRLRKIAALIPENHVKSKHNDVIYGKRSNQISEPEGPWISFKDQDFRLYFPECNSISFASDSWQGALNKGWRNKPISAFNDNFKCRSNFTGAALFG